MDKVYSCGKASIGSSVTIFPYLEGENKKQNQIWHTGFYGAWLKITHLLFCLEGQQNKLKRDLKSWTIKGEGLEHLLALKKTESQGTQTASTDGL